MSEESDSEFEVVGIDDDVDGGFVAQQGEDDDGPPIGGVTKLLLDDQTFDEETARQVIDEAFAVLQEEVINVQNSGFWLTVFSLFYILVDIFHIPMVTIVSLLILVQLLFVVVLVRLQPYLVDAGIMDKKFNARWIAEQRTSFSENEVNSIKKGFAALGYKWTKYWEDEVLDAESTEEFLFYLGILVVYTVVTFIIRLPIILLISGVTITLFPLMVDQFESTEAMVEAVQHITTATLEKVDGATTDIRRAVSAYGEE